MARVDFALTLLNQVLTLSDGRSVGVAEAGDMDGAVVLDFYPLGGSRLMITLCQQHKGLRLMSLDRPGSGLSSAAASEHVSPTHFADDICQVLDMKKVDRVHVLASCCGAVYGQAFIAKYPSRVLSAHLLAPWVSPELASASLRFVKHYIPKALVDITSRFTHSLLLASFSSAAMSTMLPEERATVDEETLLKSKAIWQENSRLSAEGNKVDMSVCVEKIPWGFTYADVTCHLAIVAGRKDTVVVPSAVDSVMAVLPDAAVEWVDASHNGVIMLHKDRILQRIAAASAAG